MPRKLDKERILRRFRVEYSRVPVDNPELRWGSNQMYDRLRQNRE